MTCPVCGAETEVIGCFKDCESVVRKRKCKECGYRFFTEEYETSDAKKHYNKLDRERRKL